MEEARGLKKAYGLMFRRSYQGCLLFDFGEEKRVLMTTLFCFFPIRMEFFNERGEKVEEAVVPPFRFYRNRKPARYVVESDARRRVRCGLGERGQTTAQ